MIEIGPQLADTIKVVTVFISITLTIYYFFKSIG